MTVQCELIGNLFVSYWDGEITAKDPEQVHAKTRIARAQAGEPLVALAIMGPNAKRPSVDAGKYMYDNMAEMRGFHHSIHIVILTQGLVATSLRTFVTLVLMDGSRGSLMVHATVEGALAEIAKSGMLRELTGVILATLKKRAIPLAPLPRS